MLHIRTLHTYVHNWSLQHFSQDCNLGSQTTYIVGSNLKHEWRQLQFKVVSERQIFEKFFHINFISHSLFLPEICCEEVIEEIFFHIYVVMCDLGLKLGPYGPYRLR